MNGETKQCQNCKQEFVVAPDDFAFYEKIKVPPPTFCVMCRHQRRLAPRNERTFYHRKCGLCKKELIAIYPEDAPFPVYCYECFWSDKWNPLEYGRAYDFSKSFFAQFKTLQDAVPRLALLATNSVNSPYVNHAPDSKNCYLIFNSIRNENCSYGNIYFESKDCLDGWSTHRSELCYQVVNCKNCYKLFFSEECEKCTDSSFLYNCTGCSNCFLCSNLKNKSYCIENVQYSQEEYKKRLAEYLDGSYGKLERAINRYRDLKQNRIVHKYRIDRKATESTGNYLYNSHHCKFCFTSEEQEYCSYVYDSSRNKDCVDHSFIEDDELCYEGMSLYRDYGSKFSYMSWYDRNPTYCALVFNSDDCFGCISLNKTSYCILNKQYTKEEYEKVIPQIIAQMNEMPYTDSKGRTYRYGEFFPVEISPFAYNETVAQEQFPLTNEQALAEGYRWKKPESRNYQISVAGAKLPDFIKDVGDSILNDIIGCAHEGTCMEQCTTAFRIIPQELEFYRKMNLPLPRLCPNCRHYKRIKQRNPLKLWQRKCTCAGEKSDNGVYINTATHPAHPAAQHCPNEFETSYAPDRSEIVYCKQCYQAEVV